MITNKGFLAYSSDWSTVSQWWEQNNMLASDVPTEDLFIEFPLISLDVLEYEKDKVIALAVGEELAGCVRIERKEWRGSTIAALGKMAVAKKWRRNHLGSQLLSIACIYMELHDFHVSILWASVLELYEEFGWFPIKDNMMLKVFRPTIGSVKVFTEAPAEIGTW